MTDADRGMAVLVMVRLRRLLQEHGVLVPARLRKDYEQTIKALTVEGRRPNGDARPTGPA